MTTKDNSIINAKLLEVYNLEYLKENNDLITSVKKETEKQLTLTDVGGSLPTSEELQDIVVKIAYSQQGEEQSDDCYAKMAMLHEFMSKYVNGNDR